MKPPRRLSSKHRIPLASAIRCFLETLFVCMPTVGCQSQLCIKYPRIYKMQLNVALHFDKAETLPWILMKLNYFSVYCYSEIKIIHTRLYILCVLGIIRYHNSYQKNWDMTCEIFAVLDHLLNYYVKICDSHLATLIAVYT